MKKILNIILIFAFSITVLFAQQSEQNQTDDRGQKQGYWKKYDEMGYVRYEGRFINNIPVGEFKYYYPDGGIRAISNMYNDGKESRTKLFHRNGKIMAEGKYFQQKKDSVWNYFSEYDGVLLSTETYAKTIKHGSWTNFYPDATVAEEIIYVDNLRQGAWRQFYTDGSLRLEGSYVNEQKEGAFKLFHPDGGLELNGTYHKDLKDGFWTEFDEDGKKLKEEEYKMGKLISESKL